MQYRIETSERITHTQNAIHIVQKGTFNSEDAAMDFPIARINGEAFGQ
jgi:hypothetical protein